MKKLLSVMLVSVMLLTQLALPSFAYDEGGFGDIFWEDEWVDPYEGLEVKSVSVEVQRSLIENVDGGTFGIENEDGTVEEHFYYDAYCAEPILTVVYENGETEIGTEYDLYGELWFYDTQEEEPWGLGKHTVTGYYRDFEFTYEVEVVETPVKSVTAVAQKTLVEGWDAYIDMYFDEDEETPPVPYEAYDVYAAEPVFTITMKDGTVVKGTDEEIYDQTGYWTYDINNQYEKPFKVGKNTVKFEYLNVEVDCEIEIVPNPYKSISIKGENEVYLVFEGVDEKDSYETKIETVWFYDGPYENTYDAEIVTENGDAYYVLVFSEVDENGIPTLNKNVGIHIGPFTTNTLENCNYFKVCLDMGSILYGAMRYYEVSEEITGKQFDGYNADEEADINDLVALSTFIAGDYEDYVEYDDYGVYKLSTDDAEKNIEKVFGITGVDVKKSDFYKFLRGVEVKEPWNTVLYWTDEELVFENDKWIVTSKVFNWETEEMVGKITVVLNEDGTVYSISLEEVEIQPGDVNCDGEVSAVDARIVLQYVAGLIEEFELNMYYSDLNGDGEITAVDARLILQKVAGLIE